VSDPLPHRRVSSRGPGRLCCCCFSPPPAHPQGWSAAVPHARSGIPRVHRVMSVGRAGTDVWSVSLLRLPHPTVRPTVSARAASVMHPCQAALLPSPPPGQEKPPRLRGATIHPLRSPERIGGMLLRVAAPRRFLTSRTLSLPAPHPPCQPIATTTSPHPDQHRLDRLDRLDRGRDDQGNMGGGHDGDGDGDGTREMGGTGSEAYSIEP